MLQQLPARTDSTPLHQLLEGWTEKTRHAGVQALVVLGPDLYAPVPAHRLLAVHPLDAQAPAYALVNASDFTAGSTRAGAALVDWRTLNAPAPSGPASADDAWQALWHARGARGVLRVGFGLSGGRSTECLVFTEQPLTQRATVDALAGAVLELWPDLKLALAHRYCPLTPRERECLERALDGLTARESAERMACTERTVNFHLANAMAKLRADNKITAIQRACWLGVL